MLDVLRAAEARGAWIVSVCTGAFTLAHAGLLDGRRCTTHWRHADEFAARFPQALLDPEQARDLKGKLSLDAHARGSLDRSRYFQEYIDSWASREHRGIVR